MANKIKIALTREQLLFLLQRINIEWQEELNFQSYEKESDTDYLEELLSVYKELDKAYLGDFLWQFSTDIEEKEKELKKLKQKEDN